MNDEQKVRYQEFLDAHLPWFEMLAKDYAMNGMGFMTGDEYLNQPRMPHKVAVEMESAYRRGYWHGYSAAMDSLRNGCAEDTWQDVAGFFDDYLTPWRYQGLTLRFQTPPEYMGNNGD